MISMMVITVVAAAKLMLRRCYAEDDANDDTGEDDGGGCDTRELDACQMQLPSGKRSKMLQNRCLVARAFNAAAHNTSMLNTNHDTLFDMLKVTMVLLTNGKYRHTQR